MYACCLIPWSWGYTQFGTTTWVVGIEPGGLASAFNSSVEAVSAALHFLFQTALKLCLKVFANTYSP